MSELENVCHALEQSIEPLTESFSALHRRALQLRNVASEVARAGQRVPTGPSVQHVVRALHEAAEAIDSTGRSLMAAVEQSRSFVDRTIGSGSVPIQELGKLAVAGVSAGTAPTAQGENVRQVAAAAIKTNGGAAYFAADDHTMRESALSLPNYPGKFVADIHGSADAVSFRDSESTLHLSAAQFANVLRESGWSGQAVQLFSCSTGQNSDGFAQQLANELGVEVTAPNLPVWAPSGWVGEGYLDASGPFPRFVKVRAGEWHTFQPKSV